MNLPVDFFRDEVRCGFYIPTAMKQAWAAELEVLAQIDKICTKHNITYFADWGTILGAVRHGGFIPWDDDLDICMKRNDYVKFRQVADAELPKEFAFHDYERKQDHWLFCTRVVSRNQICFEEEHLKKYHNFPYIASIDIFVKDYLYRDTEKEKKRCDEIMRILSVADGIVEGRLSGEIRRMRVDEIASIYHTKIDSQLDDRQIGSALYKIAEQQMARVPQEESDSIEQIFPWGLKGAKGLPKEYYDETVRLPFENTTIPVPASYHQILKNRYGDYLEIHKVWNGHDYPFYEGQRKNLQKVADFKLPEFAFDKSMFRENQQISSHNDSLKDYVIQYLDAIERQQQMPISALEIKNESVLQILPECQQLAIDLGTLIEQVKGSENPLSMAVITVLESYCEALYHLYELSQMEKIDESALEKAGSDIEKVFCDVKQQVKKNILEQKEILFLTTGPKQWKGLESIYHEIKNQNDVDVYVVPLPVVFKDIYGKMIGTNEEIMATAQLDAYPEELEMYLWTEYDLTLHRPDTVFIQDPYDGENPCLTIPHQFYSENLQKYAREIIYIPHLKTGEFSMQDDRDVYNMKHYVTAPAVVRADKIMLQSEHMKQLYVEKLTEFAGEDTRSIWEHKIMILESPDMDSEISPKRKGMFYCIGINEISEYNERLLPAVEERLKIFEEHKEQLQVTICLYPGDLNMFDTKLLTLLAKYTDESWCRMCDLKNTDWKKLVDENVAYYGSPSPVSTLFRNQKKPVMISDYGVR